MKCYLKECEKEAYAGSYWCTRTHQVAWQKENYEKTENGIGAKLSIPEIQKRLKEMGKKQKESRQLI